MEKHNRTLEKNKIEKEHQQEVFAIMNAQKNSSADKLVNKKIIGQLNDIANISKFHDSYFRLSQHLEKATESSSILKWDNSITKDQLKKHLENFKQNSSKTDFFSFRRFQQRFDSYWKTNKLSGDSLFRKLENVKDENEEIQNFTHLKPIDQLQLRLRKEFEQQYVLNPKLQNQQLILSTQQQVPKMKGQKKPILLIRKLKFLKNFWEQKQKEKEKDNFQDDKPIISPFRSATNSISKPSVKVSLHKSRNTSSRQLKEIVKNKDTSNKKYLISYRLQEIITSNQHTPEIDRYEKRLNTRNFGRSVNDLIQSIGVISNAELERETKKNEKFRQSLTEFEKTMKKCDEILSKQNSQHQQDQYEAIKLSVKKIKERKQDRLQRKSII